MKVVHHFDSLCDASVSTAAAGGNTCFRTLVKQEVVGLNLSSSEAAADSGLLIP